MQLSNKQTAPSNAFVENERQSYETQWTMRKVKSFSKNFEEFRSLFDENWPKKFLAKNMTERWSAE